MPYDLDPSIVRGLDYYRRTAWELHHEGVGAKSALGGGGRYDGLAAELGGPEPRAIGWAFGIERLLLALEAEGVSLPANARGRCLYLAALDAENVGLAAQLALQVRAVARVEFAYRAPEPGNAFKDAERRRASYAAVIGSRGSPAAASLNLKTPGASGEQRPVALDDLSTVLIRLENDR